MKAAEQAEVSGGATLRWKLRPQRAFAGRLSSGLALAFFEGQEAFRGYTEPRPLPGRSEGDGESITTTRGLLDLATKRTVSAELTSKDRPAQPVTLSKEFFDFGCGATMALAVQCQVPKFAQPMRFKPG